MHTRELEGKEGATKEAISTHRCPRAGRFEVVTEEGDQTYRAADLRPTLEPGGKMYVCPLHVRFITAGGRKAKRLV